MRRRAFLGGLSAAAAWPLAALGQQPNGRIRVIGYLHPLSEADDRRLGGGAAFREGLRDLGYVVGDNLRIEAPYADRGFDRLKPLAAELVGLNVELMLASGPAVYAARAVTTTVPIVMAPVGNVVGFVVSLSHPGGNVTGLTNFFPELSAKRLDLIKLLRPSLTRVGLMMQRRSDNPGNRPMLDAVNGTAAKLKIEVATIAVAGAADVERALADAPGAAIGALVVADEPYLADSELIAAPTQKRGLPSMGAPLYAEGGGLLGYGVDFVSLFRLAATFADKILKGAKPGDLRIEQPAKLSVVNLKTAAKLAINVPPLLLAAADEVIE